MISYIIYFLAMIILVSTSASCQIALPLWMPEEALTAAKRMWLAGIRNYDPIMLNNEYSLSSSSEALCCELKNPFQVIELHYESYRDNEDLSMFLLETACDSIFGFGIYHGNNAIGHMIVRSQNGSWSFLEQCGYGSEPRGDLYAPIYEKYPPHKGFLILREKWRYTFFVLKNRKLVETYAICNFANGRYRAIDAKKYIDDEKTRIEQLKQKRERNIK